MLSATEYLWRLDEGRAIVTGPSERGDGWREKLTRTSKTDDQNLLVVLVVFGRYGARVSVNVMFVLVRVWLL